MKSMSRCHSWCLAAAILLSGTFCGIVQADAKAAKKAPPKAPPKKQMTVKKVPFCHKTMMKAIDNGVAALWRTRNKNGVWAPYGKPTAPGGKDHYYPTGPTSAAAYALLESGVSPMDPKMKTVLDWLEKNNDKKTYSMGFRLNAWKIANRKTDGKYAKHLKHDALLLLKTCDKGHYSYNCAGKKERRSDNSCSQYGLLGIWAAKQAGLEIPDGYWKEVLKHWVKSQGKDGGWSYHACKHPYGTKPGKNKDTPPAWSNISSATMATAGLASLFVCVDNLFAKRFLRCGGNTDYPPIKKGLAWFDRNFPATMVESFPRTATQLRRTGYSYYYLYGVERVGLACGYKYFGEADWYKAGVEAILARQHKSGGDWGATHDTAYALLFLIRGKYPVVFNKLEYQGDWNNRPRDMASLTRWMSHTFEQTFNWQIINLRVPVSEMHDASFLYIAGSKAPKFTDEELIKLRTFVYQGGTLFCVGECGGTRFNKKMRAIYRKLFPKRELAKCGKEHPIYSAHFKTKGKPELYTLSNGIRPLVIHCNKDLSRSWQMGASVTQKRNFQIGINLVRYVAGGFENLRPRGVSHWPDAKKVNFKKTIFVAKLKFSGNFNPEPMACRRFALLMEQKYGVKIRFVKPKTPVAATDTNRIVGGIVDGDTIRISQLPDSLAQVAMLDGTGAFSLNSKDQETLKKWVEAGGTLVLNATGGNKTFAKSAKKTISRMFKDAERIDLPVDSEIYTLKGLNINKVKYRGKGNSRRQRPGLTAIMLKKRPAVIFSRDDITAGLVGYPSGLVNGYKPKYAFDIMRNITLVADRHTPSALRRKIAAEVARLKAEVREAEAAKKKKEAEEKKAADEIKKKAEEAEKKTATKPEKDKNKPAPKKK